MPKKVDRVASSGSTLYRSASAQNSSFSSATLSGCLGRQVVRLAEIVGQVIQLDRIGVWVPDAGRVRFQGLRV